MPLQVTPEIAKSGAIPVVVTRPHIDLGASAVTNRGVISTHRAAQTRGVDSESRVGITRDGVGVGTAGAYGRSSLISSGNPSYTSDGGRRNRTFNNRKLPVVALTVVPVMVSPVMCPQQ